MKISKYLIPLNEIPVSNEIESSVLDIELKSRSNLLPWKGQFSPQLVETFIDTFCSSGGANIFDPFMGSGTVIIESVRKKNHVFGTELNPAAFYLSQIYSLVKTKDKKSLIANINDILNPILVGDLFTVNIDENNLAEILADITKKNREDNLKIILQALYILLDIDKNALSVQKVRKTWLRLSEIILNLPFENIVIDLKNADARASQLKSNTIDLVITSPPYINVFNYHQQYRGSIENLNWNLLEVAKSEIGSNRKNRGNRFLTVIQYVFDMFDVFIEIKRVLKDSGKVIFVVGRESNVMKTRFFNTEIIISIAVLAGFDKIRRMERNYVNRFGQKIKEDIIIIGTFNNNIERRHELLGLCLEILHSAEMSVPVDQKPFLADAIKSITNVIPSPVYVGKKSA
ncbi:DNA methyltransferase [Leptospira vanthielii]|uniref:Methyltransferase n=1 Tax=Leptospira vanthielii serovar Holland str. Waz Holland = ATCC 700522 TaxID=1218591 RepID=N1WEK9_9LEPT|nr:DNA methyltransferase [Leptospira vanthielii]EMY71642.1 D12 class N6 adenine-specific DNA methyltransferase [Leptospira vanthielii serovar Holland str. Waz Holland = ATCC 700522]